MAFKILSCGLLLAVSLFADSDPLAPLQFLAGDWIGEGGGASTGEFTFHPDAQGKVLLRKNWAEYPAANGKPAFRHEDLMMIYADGPKCEAVYVDSEGHVIHYTVETTDGTVRFVSPQYRLIYKKTSAAAMSGTFEIAPPGKAGEYKQYLAWTARRK